MKKRKFMALALSCVMVCSLVACGGKDTGSDQPASNSTPAPAEKTDAPTEKTDAPAENADTTENTDSQTPADSLRRQRTLLCGLILLEIGEIPLQLIL